MVYREPAGFFCTAEKLLELILKDDRVNFEKHKDWLIFSVRDIYEELPLADFQEVLLMMLSLPYGGMVSKIIKFGKENNISEQSWFEAIENKTQNGTR